MSIYHLYNQEGEGNKMICLGKVSRSSGRLYIPRCLQQLSPAGGRTRAFWSLYLALFCHFFCGKWAQALFRVGICLVSGASTGSAAAGGGLLWGGAGLASTAPCSPSAPQPLVAPHCRKNANTSLCLSSFPPKRAVSLLMCNFQLTRHQAPAQRLSQCAKEEKKNQPNNSGEDISF